MLVLDAGTGLARVGDLVAGPAFSGTIALTHMHWDHMQGIPFFPEADRAAADVDLLMPDQGDAFEILARPMSPPSFPIDPNGLIGSWSFAGIDEGDHRVDGLELRARDVPHKGGRTFGYRVTDGAGHAIAYVPDHGPLDLGEGEHGHGVVHSAARDLAQDVSVLVHGGPYDADEVEIARAFGHSTIDYAVELAATCGVGRLIITHHEPRRSDDDIDDLEQRARRVMRERFDSEIGVTMAREGGEVVL